MKHIYILTILLSIVAYVLCILAARDSGEAWGYVQWIALGLTLPILTLGCFNAWAQLTRDW